MHIKIFVIGRLLRANNGIIALKCPHINVTVVDADEEKIAAWNGP